MEKAGKASSKTRRLNKANGKSNDDCNGGTRSNGASKVIGNGENESTGNCPSESTGVSTATGASKRKGKGKNKGEKPKLTTTRRNEDRRAACLDMVGPDESLLFADGLDEVIVGIAERDGTTVVVYDAGGIINVLRKRDGMTKSEAEEFFAFNIARAHVGDQTPIFVRIINFCERASSSGRLVATDLNKLEAINL